MRVLLYKTWFLLMKIIINTSIFVSAYYTFEFVFMSIYLALPFSLYFTYCVHNVLRNHTSIYDIPYDDIKAYLIALEEYNKANMELLKGELVTDYIPSNSNPKIFIILLKLINILPNHIRAIELNKNDTYMPISSI